MVDYFILLLGGVAMIQGLPYLLSPDSVRKRAKKIAKTTDTAHRFTGAAMCALAVFILYLAL